MSKKPVTELLLVDIVIVVRVTKMFVLSQAEATCGTNDLHAELRLN